jgi:hypothetical protein
MQVPDLPARELVPGDVVELYAGEASPHAEAATGCAGHISSSSNSSSNRHSTGGGGGGGIGGALVGYSQWWGRAACSNQLHQLPTGLWPQQQAN